MLKIKDLNVETNEGKKILHNIDINILDNEIHVIMGPNGSGKSTICKSIMHHPSYKITNGSIIYNDKDITNLDTSKIASAGIYYISQSPIEIEGIKNAELIRTSMLDNGHKMDIITFNKKCNEVLKKIGLPKDFLYREVNMGMSGGERKKAELFGMFMLEPSLVILDEIDSGLDVDALTMVANSINEYKKESKASFIVVTHQEKLIELLKPDKVEIFANGTIVKRGDYSLAKETLEEGFLKYTNQKDKDE